MINNINKNISVWRGEKTPPTEYHVWIKSNGSVLINKDGTWFTQISESTNDSVNVINLSNIRHIPSVLAAAQVVKQYLGSEVFHVGYKLRYNEAPTGYDPIWREYIFTGSTWQNPKDWKLLSTTDLMDDKEIIKSKHLPSYVDDVLEYSTVDEFPTRGESGKIYLDTSTNKSYRWSGTQYILIALTDIVTADTMGLMSPEMYNKLEKTASDLDIHDRQNQVAFAEISTILDKKVGKIVDAKGNVISEGTSVATIPDGTDKNRGLLTPAVYKLVDYLDNYKVEEIKDFQGNVLPKVGTIVTIPNATTQKAGLMTPDDKEILNKIQPEFVKDLGLVASTDEGDQMAAKSEIAGNTNISFIRYRTTGVSAEKVTTIFQWRNGINETAQIKFVDKAQWRRNVTGATGVEGATTSTTPWERTGAHYLGYDAASRTLQLKDYNQTVFRTVQLPLAQHDADVTIDGLISSEDFASIITKADFNRWTGEIYLNNKENNRVTSLLIPIATKDGRGLMSENDVIEIGTLTEHRINRNNPHQVTKSQIGLGNVTNDAQVKRSEMGVANGVATLNSEGKISSSYLPSYVSDVITADSYSTLPTTGEEDKIYVTKDTNLTYRWSGTAYVEISPSIALGETSTTAYAGDRGKYLFDKVTDLSNRVGSGWVDTENGFVKIGTGSDSVSITPGATIHASIEGDSSGVFTISSSTEQTYLGYGANIGKGSKLGQNISATVESVRGPEGWSRPALVLQEVGSDTCLKILCRSNGELKLSTSSDLTHTSGWIDLARLNKISTMIDVEMDRGVVFYPDRLSDYQNDTEIVVGTNTTIGSNVTIGSYSNIGGSISVGNNASIGGGVSISPYVKVSTSIKDDGTGYVLFGDGSTKIKKGVTIDGNSGSSEQRVHEYTAYDLDSWLVGTNTLPSTTCAQLGKGIIILGTSQLNQPILIKAQNRNNATALIGANFNAYSGVTLGTNANIGIDANIGANVSMGYRASIGQQVDISDYVAVGTSVIGSSSGDSVEIGNDITIATGINITKNTAATTIQNNNASSFKGGKLTFGTGNIIWDGVEIGTGVHITENLTSDSTSYTLGETSQTTIGKNIRIISGDNNEIDIYNGNSQITSYGNVELGTNVKLTASLRTTSSSDGMQLYYILSDPSSPLNVSTIQNGVELGSGVAIKNEVTIYGGVEIGSGIQIRDSSTGLQIYSPTQKKWITIS